MKLTDWTINNNSYKTYFKSVTVAQLTGQVNKHLPIFNITTLSQMYIQLGHHCKGHSELSILPLLQAT